MTCAWCRGPIVGLRRDAKFCGVRCRQASHRFGKGCVARARAATPMRLAYADPPYPGKAHLYRGHPDYDGEVDHAALASRLQAYDGFALSTSSAALQEVLGYFSIPVKVAPWIRGSRAGHGSSWEAVVYAGGRRRVQAAQQYASARAMDYASPRGHRDASRKYSRDDSLVLWSRPRLTDPDRVIGAKPAGFIWWMFDLIGARPGDTMDDLFPGSGGVGRAWDILSAATPGEST